MTTPVGGSTAGSEAAASLARRVAELHDRAFNEDGSKRVLDDDQLGELIADARPLVTEGYELWNESGTRPRFSDPAYDAPDLHPWFMNSLPVLVGAFGAGTAITGIVALTRPLHGSRGDTMLAGMLISAVPFVGAALFNIGQHILDKIRGVEKFDGEAQFHADYESGRAVFVPEWLDELADSTVSDEENRDVTFSHVAIAEHLMRLLDRDGSGELEISRVTGTEHDERLAHVDTFTMSGPDRIDDEPPSAGQAAVDFTELLVRADDDGNGDRIVQFEELENAMAAHVDDDATPGLLKPGAHDPRGLWRFLEHARDASPVPRVRAVDGPESGERSGG